MVDEDDLLELEAAALPRRKGARRGLTVRMLAAKTEWLEGLPVWREDRVWWQTGDQAFHPETSDLAQTERTLNRIRRYPRATDQTVGDGESWLARRFERLQLVKSLAVLRCADPGALAKQAREREPAAILSLCRLLRAEAYCANDLPVSPTSLLLEARGAAIAPFRAVLSDASESLDTRALAAMALGALARGADDAPDLNDPWLRRAWQWGRKQGLTSHPGLTAGLLRSPEGRSLAYRCLAALSQENALPGSECLRKWLYEGVPEATVVEIAEALGPMRGISEQLRNWRPLLPDFPRKKRHAEATYFAQVVEMVEPRVRAALLAIADTTRSPEAVARALETLAWLLPDTTPTLAWADEAVIPVRAAVKLPRECAVAWLELLHRYRHTLWPDYEAFRSAPDEKRDLAHLQVQRPWCASGLPLFRFLERTLDPALAEEALKLGVAPWVGRLETASLDTYRAAFAVARSLGACRNGYHFSTVCEMVRQFRDPGEARRTLRPLIEVLQRAPEDYRATLFLSLAEELHQPGGRSRLKRLPAYLELILRELPEELDWKLVDSIASVLVSLDKTLGEAAEDFAEAVVRRALALSQEKSEHHQGVWRMTSALEIACGLRDPGEEPDLAFVEVFLNHDLPSWKAGRDEGLKLLSTLPNFRRVIREAFSTQPHRCLSLIERLGLTGKLAVEARQPLHALESEPPPLPTDSHWTEVLRHAPDLELAIRAYLRDCALVGQAGEVPPALRHALRRSQKLARELAYLDSRPDLHDQPGIRARRESLRGQLARLAESDSGLASEIRDHLANIAAETVLAAAERLIDECYRRALKLILGPLAEQLALDEDWLNAALLSGSIEQNRLLLRRMLRAEAEGVSGWRERHPVNARFLEGLSARGVNAEVWLSRRPRSAPCESVAGKKVRLHLEQRPLRILQMGNYFDTCLSADGCNAFSTVANACELNKRVVYATDGKGRIVARKLIGLNEQGDLIGFATYTNVDTSEARTDLCRIVRAYIEDFANACGLTLSNEGTVPKLFAQAWYDDGRRDWEGDEPSSDKAQAHASRAAPMFARFSSRSSP